MRKIRSKEETEKRKIKKRANKYILITQPNFNGDNELLARMQDMERAYLDGEPIISDEEWDSLIAKTGYVESLEVLSSSNRARYKFIHPMMSLKKINMTSLKKFIKPDCLYEIQPKIDGLSFCAVYKKTNKKHKLSLITTRGDGISGLCIHPNALFGVTTIGLPEFAEFEADDVEIRGEAVISRADYEPSVSARSIASGILNRKNPTNTTWLLSLLPKTNEELKEKKALLKKYNAWPCRIENDRYFAEKEILPSKENLTFVSFSMCTTDGIVSCPELKNKGFLYIDSVPGLEHIYKITNKIEDIEESLNFIYGKTDGITNRHKFEYPVDGLVIKSKSEQVCIKLPGDVYETKVLRIRYHTTSLGNETCTAEIEPVKVDTGAIVSKVNLHNPSWLANRPWIKEGASCKLTMLNDIMPILIE